MIGDFQKRPADRRWLHAIGGTLVFGVTLSGAPACDDHIIGHGIPIGVGCLREPPLDWDNFGDAIIGRHCRPCHSVLVREGLRADAPPDVNFDTYADVQQWADRIQARSVDTTTMPPAGGMLDSERANLGEWLQCDVFPSLGQVDVELTTTTEGGS